VRRATFSPRSAVVVAVVALAMSAESFAQGGPELAPVDLDVEGVDPALLTEEGLTIVVDGDDDDEDGEVDARQTENVPREDLRVVVVRGTKAVVLRTSESLRVVRDGRALDGEVRLARRELPATLGIQGTRASRSARDAFFTVESASASVRVPVTVVGAALLDAENRRIDPRLRSVGVSRAITNDASLPRRTTFLGSSPDPENVRIEVFDPSKRGLRAQAMIVSEDPATGRPYDRRTLTLTRPREDGPFRSEFIRLVSDVMDQEAPGVGHRVLRVGLRQVLRVEYEALGGAVGTSVRVGRPGDEEGTDAARRAALRIRILRHRPGGVPAVGGDDETAIRIARDQVRIANEVWLQCYVDFGPPGAADVAVVDPPPPSMLSFADGSALPARGGGLVRFRANGQRIRVETRPGALPIDTALTVREALLAHGLVGEVTENPPAEFGAGRSADVVVRDARGALALLAEDGNAPVSTDGRQTVVIAEVDLTDGLQEFDNMTAAAGTLEERALIKMLADRDASTIDVFVVSRFTSGTRQGEAFIESDGGAIVNTVLLDRNGIRQEREAWTQSHEIGHVLLDMPFHPDNVGPDRPWLLMDADSSQGLVTGPKRLTLPECHRVRARSGVHALPALLRRLDAREHPPTAPTEPFDLGYPRE
jgi:hypothetical protein